MIRKQPPACLAALMLTSLIAACGGDDAARSTASSDSKAATARKGPASAGQVAEEMRGQVRCPAKIKTPKRGNGAPAIDVVGVIPGMTYDEAANVVMCSHELLVVTEDKSRGFHLQTYGATIRKGFNAKFATERVERTSQQIMKEMQDNAMARSGNRAVRDVLPGQSKWYVSTIGLPGEERVVNAAREEWFETNRNPTVAAVQQALLDKYGTPTQIRSSNDDSTEMRWAYDPRGRLITETSPLYHQCHGAADPDVGAQISADCGVAIAASIRPLRENPALSQYLQVGVVDQAAGYELLTTTEQTLQQSEMQRRAEQVEDANKKAVRPTL